MMRGEKERGREREREGERNMGELDLLKCS